MARPKAKELTERELEIMHVFWELGEETAQQVRQELAVDGRNLAYTTVATLVKILVEKGFVEQTTDTRPFTYKPIRSFKDVSANLVGDLVNRVFGGSREQLLVQLMSQKKLAKKEREVLERFLSEQKGKKK